MALSTSRKKRELSEHTRPEAPWTAGRWLRIVIAGAILVLYAAANTSPFRGQVVDIEAVSVPAWHFVETRTWDLSTQDEANIYFVETDRGVRSNRAPGLIATAVFGYAVTSLFTDGFEDWPGSLVAVVTSWLAVLVVAATADRLKPGLWIPALVLFGLGTATWSVSSMGLWPHGPAQLTVALGVYYLVRGRDLWAGLAFAVGVLIRPAVVILGFGVAIVKAAKEKSWRPLLTIGGPSALSAFLYLAYNRVTFGSWSPLAAYDAAGGLWLQDDLAARMANIGAALFGASNGVIFWSTWLFVCVVLFLIRPPTEPSWLRYTPAIAVVFIVVHSSLEVASGGLPYNYRYPLEAITLAAPALLLTIPAIRSKWAGSALFAAAALSLFLHGTVVVWSRCGLDATGDYICRLFG